MMDVRLFRADERAAENCLESMSQSSLVGIESVVTEILSRPFLTTSPGGQIICLIKVVWISFKFILIYCFWWLPKLLNGPGCVEGTDILPLMKWKASHLIKMLECLIVCPWSLGNWRAFKKRFNWRKRATAKGKHLNSYTSSFPGISRVNTQELEQVRKINS